MSKREAFIVYRVLSRLVEQALDAYRYGREADAIELAKLTGRLQYRIFECAGFESALERAA
jgi:hypothetical protein